MPFFSNLSKKVGNIAKTAAKKSGDLVGTTKLNMTINSEEDKIKKLYSEIGKSVYNKFQGGNNFESDLMSMCQQANEIEKSIGLIRQKISEIKNIKICPNCKSELELNITFCAKCGTKQEMGNTVSALDSQVSLQNQVPQQNYESQPVQMDFIPHAVEKTCPSCGTTVVETTSFCPNCGTKI